MFLETLDNFNFVNLFKLIIILLFIFVVSCSSGTSTQNTNDNTGTNTGTDDNSDSSDNSDNSDSSGTTTYTSLAESDWDIVWTGSGSVDFTNGITLEPAATQEGEDGHSSLIISKDTENNPISDFTVTVTVTTQEQLNAFEPEPWHVFWLFFNYKIATNGYKETNYFILKPNGIELGTAYDSVGQDFLYTQKTPQLTINQSNIITLDKSGQIVTVTIDGEEIFTYDGNEEEYPLFDHAGSIGLYTEEARVFVSDIEIIPE